MSFLGSVFYMNKDKYYEKILRVFKDFIILSFKFPIFVFVTVQKPQKG